MKRYQFNEATAHLFNSVREVNGIKIGVVGWHLKPWKVVDTLDFGTIVHRPHEAGYIAPIAEFGTRDELWKYLKDKLAP